MTVKTNSKLIKLSDEHYVIVDDSEQITFKDWFFDIDTKIVGQYFHGLREDAWMKITHSTEPLEPGVSIGFETSNCFNQIKPLSLSEVDESLLPKTEWEVEFDEQGKMLIKC